VLPPSLDADESRGEVSGSRAPGSPERLASGEHGEDVALRMDRPSSDLITIKNWLSTLLGRRCAALRRGLRRRISVSVRDVVI
jgi:hypothetical protein